MTKSILYSLLILIFSGIVAPINAQDSGVDDYSDYSYLWEDSKKKKKKKNKDQPVEQAPEEVVEPEPQAEPEPQIESTPEPQMVTPPADSLINENNIPSDSTNNEVEQPEESLETTEPEPQVEEMPEEVPQESTIPQDTTTQEEPEEIQEEKPKKEKKPKKERPDTPPVQDFRAGSGVQSGGSFDGGLTVTNIDNQYFVGMVLNPEFSIGKVGVGLNVPILYGLDDKSIRTEIFKDGVGAARLITYVRYGIQKRDPIYVKVGQLNNTMVGFGGLINNYTNSTSFEKRKLGIHYDVNYKGFVGIEGLYSDFSPGSFNLFSIRPYVRPLIFTGIPIVKTFEIGATIVSDKDQTDIPTSDSTATTYMFTRDGVGAFGIDAGLTLLSIPFIQIDLFANYSNLNISSPLLTDSLTATYNSLNEPTTLADGFKSGSGTSVGLNFRFNFIADLLSTDIRIERLNYQDHYLPQFFDATYEINKDNKIYALGAAQSMKGIYGSLTGQILKKVELGGSLMIPDVVSAETPATVRVHANLDRLADKFSFHGSYIKGNLTDLGDAFTFDQRSLAKLRAIYHLNKFLATGLDYYWAFTPTGDGGYKATQYVSPYFGLSIKF
ncbi:MAG: hypothetical protein JXR10_01380 [Cyclobacteriaceae bacterium]